ncbi:hypothetical protein MTP99_011428 [Tenebrio molitor]|nr:hypothetical protein MTP99_011428 [Tenebrio molitor]
MSKLLAVLVLATLFQGYYCLDRQAIIDEYTPMLAERTTNYTTESDAAITETDLIIAEMRNDVVTAMSTMNTQIANLKTQITNATKTYENNTDVVSCANATIPAANALSAVPINSTCWVGVTFPELGSARDAFATLAEVPGITISSCADLNPLPSQDELFLDCITHKILDLDEQITLVENNFLDEKASALNETVNCIQGQSSLIIQQINEIHYQLSLCVSLG